MSGLPLTIVAVLVLSVVLGAVFVLGTPILAIPILLLLPGPIFMLATMRRQLRQRQISRFRRQAKAQKSDFDDRDERTIV